MLVTWLLMHLRYSKTPNELAVSVLAGHEEKMIQSFLWLTKILNIKEKQHKLIYGIEQEGVSISFLSMVVEIGWSLFLKKERKFGRNRFLGNIGGDHWLAQLESWTQVSECVCVCVSIQSSYIQWPLGLCFPSIIYSYMELLDQVR